MGKGQKREFTSNSGANTTVNNGVSISYYTPKRYVARGVIIDL